MTETGTFWEVPLGGAEVGKVRIWRTVKSRAEMRLEVSALGCLERSGTFEILMQLRSALLTTPNWSPPISAAIKVPSKTTKRSISTLEQ